MKNNRVVLIVIGVILLCCCIAVVVGVIAYPTIQQYLNSAAGGLQNLNPAATQAPSTVAPSAAGPVDGGLGDPTLKGDVWTSILAAEAKQSCTDVTSTAIDVTQQPDSKGVWIEDWTINACGTTAVLHITFTPNPKGGTDYVVKQ